ncbi:MAG: hypothetical protein HKN52_06385, partial [Eudoraea sp.]|nr:hypothetical protein [Eudoraea sp.]
MKIILSNLLLAIALAFTIPGNAHGDSSTLNNTGSNTSSETSTIAAAELFKAAAKEHNIATKTVRGLTNIFNGYYLVTGVFGVQQNAKKFVRALKSKHLDAKLFTNPENGLNYVYIARATHGNEAISSYFATLNSGYKDKVWILNVIDSKEFPIETRKELVATSLFENFKSAAKENNIATRTIVGLSDVQSGYYVIAGVFGDRSNVAKFKRQLSSKNITAYSLTHPKTQLNYVYLQHTQDWKEALASSISKFDGRYKQKVWIMNIQANAQKLSKDNIDNRLDKTTAVTVRKPMLAEITKTFLSKDPPNSKLIQKADDYFDKMWYAEAAELYELVLSESKENYTYEIIQKAGDSHYFNSNMERAYHWYDILYTSYKNEVSAENIFKYAHSLKGTGKYARAKRLMRLYDKKLKKEGGRRYALNDPRTTPKEKVLDNILATEQPDYTIRNIATNSEYSDFSPMF